MLYVRDVRLPDSQVNVVPRSDGRQSDQMYLGVYNTLEKAVAAYDRAALKFYGKGAALNVRPPAPCLLLALACTPTRGMSSCQVGAHRDRTRSHPTHRTSGRMQIRGQSARQLCC